MKVVIGITAGLIAALVAFVAWAEFPDECEPSERESDHRLALCKWNSDVTVDHIEFQAYTDYPYCRLRLRVHGIGDDELPPSGVKVGLNTGDSGANWEFMEFYEPNYGSGTGGLVEEPVVGDGYLDLYPQPFGWDENRIHMDVSEIQPVRILAHWSNNPHFVESYKLMRADFRIEPRNQYGEVYSIHSNIVPLPDTLVNWDPVIAGCIDKLHQIKADREHAAAEAARERQEIEEAKTAAAAAKLEEEQAIREAQTQARIDEAKLAAAVESKKRVIEAERIKTQTLITKIETERAVADILFEITRVRLRGTEERAALTNEWLEERARETEEFSKEIVEIEESIQRYNEFNRAFLDSIQRYQDDIDARVAMAEQQLQALIDEAIALSEVEGAENEDE